MGWVGFQNSGPMANSSSQGSRTQPIRHVSSYRYGRLDCELLYQCTLLYFLKCFQTSVTRHNVEMHVVMHVAEHSNSGKMFRFDSIRFDSAI